MNEADLERIRELPQKLMLLADALDASKGIIGDEGQQDLRWLSEQLPLILDQLVQTQEEVDRLNRLIDVACEFSSSEEGIDS